MRQIRRVIISGVVAILVELLVFNFSAIMNQISGNEVIFFSAKDFRYQNWQQQEDGSKVSLADPVLYIDGLSAKVKTLTIRANMDVLPSSYTIFYTTEPTEVFSAEKMIVVEAKSDEVEISLGQRVCALLVDLGDEAGVVLRDISLTLNDVGWDFSAARVIAMLIVYWGTIGLMRLQKSADYGIDEEGGREQHEA